MRKTLFFLLFFPFLTISVNAQMPIDALIQKLETTKSDDERVDALFNFISNTSEFDPVQDFKNGQKLLRYSRKHHDDVAESLALNQISYNYKQFGNFAKGLEFGLKAVEVAEGNGNKKLIGFIKVNLSLIYRDLGNAPKAIELLRSAEKLGMETRSYVVLETAYQNLAEIYFAQNKIDQALTLAQKDYEISIKNNYRDWIGYTLIDLGSIHGKLNNRELALNYFEMAVREAKSMRAGKILLTAYLAKSDYFKENKMNDSSMANAKKAIAAVRYTPFSNYAIKPAKMLLDAYRGQNADSAFKYSEIYRVANDSLFSAKAMQQTQQMTFQNELQVQQAEEERRNNIQYAFIATGIITFFIFFLLLSRTIIVNEKWISFLAILALLLVFEFINLLIHPFLGNLTHHSPIWMLLCMVALASLLIPLHHKLEHFIKHKLTEKNKAIRLAAAKKTIEQLESEIEP
jgi:tetratricopeptide (TPR) repeat protein